MCRAVIDYHLSREIFRPCLSNLQSSSCSNSPKNVPISLSRTILTKVSSVLQDFSLVDFLTANVGIFSPRALNTDMPVIRTLLCFQPEPPYAWKYKDFDGSAL